MIRLIFFISCSVLINHSILSQKKDCAVNLNGLDQSYEGECKKGLAHGDGTAMGTLGKYVGEFKKGFPNGIGKLEYYGLDGTVISYYEGEWARGSRDGSGTYYHSIDSILTGYWKDDVYIGLYENDYTATVRGSLRYRINYLAEKPNSIEVQFVRDGVRQMNDIVSISSQSSSGSELRQSTYFGYEQVEYPFEGRFILTLNNKLRTNTYNAEFTYTINKPGKWMVVLDY